MHRAAYSITGGRFGLRTPTDTRWGMLRLKTVGRRTGKEWVAITRSSATSRTVSNLVISAMNGWANPGPAWRLNLQVKLKATAQLSVGRRDVTARPAVGEESDWLWRRLVDLGSSAYTEANAATRASDSETAIVVLEPVSRT